MPDSNFKPLQSYVVNLATPQTIEAMRYWVQDELLRLTNMVIEVNADYRENVVFAGYGGIIQATPVSLPNITAGFQTLPADTALPDYASRDVTYDLADDALAFSTEGVWRVTVIAAITFDDVNAGRTFDVQLYNPDDSTVVTETTVFIGRNQDGFNISLTALFPIQPVNVKDDIVIRIGNASSTFTSVELLNYRLDVNRVSEVKGAA